jgi:hypothetical protein
LLSTSGGGIEKWARPQSIWGDSEIEGRTVDRELQSDGYSARSVDDKVTTDIIRRYIEYQMHEETSFSICMFTKP